MLGTIAGVLIAGYWVRARARLSLGALYTRDQRYWYSGGWNWRAVVATVRRCRSSAGPGIRPPADGEKGSQGLAQLV